MASKDRIRIKLRVPGEVVALIRGCQPQLKRKIRAGLRYILTELSIGQFPPDRIRKRGILVAGQFTSALVALGVAVSITL
jgi:hypothetical protein